MIGRYLFFRDDGMFFAPISWNGYTLVLSSAWSRKMVSYRLQPLSVAEYLIFDAAFGISNIKLNAAGSILERLLSRGRSHLPVSKAYF